MILDDFIKRKEQQYLEKCNTLGETHPDTLNSLRLLVHVCTIKKSMKKRLN